MSTTPSILDDLLRGTGTTRLPNDTQVTAVFRWPVLFGLSDLADELIEASYSTRRRGRRSTYPTAALLGLWIAARITGSLASILKLVRPLNGKLADLAVETDSDLWARVIRPLLLEHDPEMRVPLEAPNRDIMMHFRERLLTSIDGSDNFQDRFQRYAVLQAQTMGNLIASQAPSGIHPSLRTTIVGDGCVIRPFSDVRLVPCPITGELIASGSRALYKPRVPDRLTDLTEDGKTTLRGLNMVSMGTLTEYGWIVLGTMTAFGAELWAALDLLDSITDKADLGVETLLYDRVITGWPVDYAMGRRGVRVVNKMVSGRKKDRDLTAPGSDNLTPEQAHAAFADAAFAHLASQSRVERALADHGGSDSPIVRHHWTQAELYDMWINQEPQPLGTCLHRATSASHVTGSRNQANRKKMEVERSQFHHFGTRSHTGEDGQECSHDLWVDGDALHTLEFDPDLGCSVKVATATCTKSERRQNANGAFTTTEVWTMPCPNGDFMITTTWTPNAGRNTVDTPEDQRAHMSDPALTSLRPISRHDRQEFADIANSRNFAESYNEWFQNTLPKHGRAASLHTSEQEFDFLAAACLRNANTWHLFEADNPLED